MLLWGICLIIGNGARVTAQVPGASEAPWRIANFAPDAGVLRRMVFNLAFETNNTAWFAASDGLYRYDGYHWRRFTTADGLPSSFVRTVTVTRDGSIWIGTDKGAGVFDGRTFDRRGTDQNLAGPNVRRIVETADGSLWFCCDSWPDASTTGGLTRFQAGGYRTYRMADGLPADHTYDLFEQSSGRWIAFTSMGPAVLQGERWIPFSDPGYPPNDNTWTMHETPAGIVFAQAFSSTMVLRHGQWSDCRDEGDYSNGPLCVTRDGSVVKSRQAPSGAISFARWNGLTFVGTSTEIALPGLSVFVLRQAPDGSVWAVGRGTILRWEYAPGMWEWYPELPEPAFEDDQRRLWFANISGAVLMDRSRLQEFGQIRTPLIRDGQGAVWSAGGTGLMRYMAGQMNSVPYDECHLSNLGGGTTDAAGRVWLYGKNQESKWTLVTSQPGGWKVYVPDALGDRQILSVAPDAQQGVWVVLNDTKTSVYEIAWARADGIRMVGIHGNKPRTHLPKLCVTRSHAFLYGYNGLWESPLADALTFTNAQPDADGVFTQAASTPDTAAFVSQEGMDGNAVILVRRPNGWLRHPVAYGEALRLGPDGWLMVADGPEVLLWQVNAWHAPTYLSLPTDTTITAMLRTANGEFWLGTYQGVFHLRPGKALPETLLTGPTILQGGHLTGVTAKGLAPYRPRSQSRRHSFSWRIDSGPWSPFNDWPTNGIPLGDLRRGPHQLQARARDGLGNEDPTPASLAFEVLPIPIQNRLWFRPAMSAIGLGFGALSLALFRATRRLRRHADLLEEMVQARTAELRQDIARREQVQQALRESESRLRANLENTPDVAVQWYDPAGRIVYWNHASEVMYGWKSDEVKGQTLDTCILAPKEAAEFLEILAAIRKTGNPYGPYEVAVRRRDGRTRLMWATVFAIPLSEGQAGFACMDVDITERKQNEKVQETIARISEVAMSARNLEDLFPAIHQVIAELMSAPNFYFALLDPKEEMIHFPYYHDAKDPMPPPRKLRRGLSEHVLRSGKPLLATAAELRDLEAKGHFDPQGSQPVSWLGVPLRTQEHILGVMTVQSYTDDIRYGERERDLLVLVSYHVANAIERKRAEQENARLQSHLLQAQKMESVGRLAGGVAHDFNNMLQAILGNVALALEQTPASGQLHDDLMEIQKAAERSASLTSQLLAFARKQTVRPQVLDLNDTLAGMLNMLRRLIGENIHLAWLPSPGLWPVEIDPSQVDQMLANLTVNARDAISGSGKITIETANLTLDDTYAQTHADCVPGDYVLLAVSDNGRGMDRETQGHLFEPFFTTKDVGEGTGLGLATVYGIVKQNGGLINVYSELGQGTTFKIYLPRATAQVQPPATATEGKSLRGTETVLLVEDETQILDLGQRILRQQGYTVITAPTPKAALAAMTQHQGPLHLLITDVVMPGMNGKELFHRLRPNFPELKCLFMSGYTANVIAHHGVLDAGVHFLQKPFTVQTLAEKVRQVLTQPNPGKPPRQGANLDCA